MRQSSNSQHFGNINYSKLYNSLTRSNSKGLQVDGSYALSASETPESKPFASQSKNDVMHRNLKSGLMYLDKQKENLTEIGKIVDTWRFSMEREKKNARHFDFQHLRNVIYIDPITKLVEEKFHNRLLFGDGSESTVRIHLMIEGRRYEIHLNVVPLLIDPGFQAIMHSGQSYHYPSDSVFDHCCRHIINCMLEVEHNRTELDSKIELVMRNRQKNLNITALNSIDALSPVIKGTKNRRAIYEKIVGFLMTKFPVTSMASFLLPLTLLKKF